MFLLKQILPAVTVAIVSSILVSMISIIWIKSRAQRISALSFSIAIGYTCAHFFLTGWPSSFPPVNALQWLPIFALVAAASSLIFSFPTRKSARILLFSLLAIGALRLLLQAPFRYVWSNSTGWIWVVGLGITIVLLAEITNSISKRSSFFFETPLFLFLACSGTSLALSLSGSLLLGQYAGVLGAALTGTLILLWKNSESRVFPSFVFSLLFVALIISGYYFSNLPLESALLLGISPALTLAPLPLSIPWQLLSVRILFMVIPITLALFLAFKASPPLTY